MHRFDRDTGVIELGPGVYEACIDPGWWIVDGPNGGYVAAVLLRALIETVGDASRAPRSLTIHYAGRPREGPARIATSVERSGRSFSTLSARLSQGDSTLAVALATFSPDRAGFHFQDRRRPEAPPPESLEPMRPSPGQPEVTFRDRLDSRSAFGPPEAGRSDAALVGGWIRPSPPRLLDAPLLATLCDAWPPAVMARVEPRAGAPTIDLTIHFRGPIPGSARPGDFYLAVFRSQTAIGGFAEEDGEIWTRDGLLLAHSRQLALLR